MKLDLIFSAWEGGLILQPVFKDQKLVESIISKLKTIVKRKTFAETVYAIFKLKNFVDKVTLKRKTRMESSLYLINFALTMQHTAFVYDCEM